MSELRAGDRVVAKEGTVAELWADGNVGTILETRDQKGYSGNDSNNIVRWDGGDVRLGFRHEEVELA